MQSSRLMEPHCFKLLNLPIELRLEILDHVAVMGGFRVYLPEPPPGYTIHRTGMNGQILLKAYSLSKILSTISCSKVLTVELMTQCNARSQCYDPARCHDNLTLIGHFIRAMLVTLKSSRLKHVHVIWTPQSYKGDLGHSHPNHILSRAVHEVTVSCSQQIATPIKSFCVECSHRAPIYSGQQLPQVSAEPEPQSEIVNTDASSKAKRHDSTQWCCPCKNKKTSEQYEAYVIRRLQEQSRAPKVRFSSGFARFWDKPSFLARALGEPRPPACTQLILKEKLNIGGSYLVMRQLLNCSCKCDSHMEYVRTGETVVLIKEVCGAQFASYRQYQSHMSDKHKLYKCLVRDCGQAFVNEKGFQDHRRSEHGWRWY